MEEQKMTQPTTEVDASSVSQVSQDKAPQEVSALSIVLRALELAQQRGAFKLDEVSIISQAYTMLAEQERKSAPTPAPTPTPTED